MRTILEILKKAGGWHPGLYLKIENQPYMELVIEAVDELGTMGLPTLSVPHYGEQNGDLMRDPEMCFELGFHDGPELNPFYYRNDHVGVEQWSRNIVRDHYVSLELLHQQHERFAKTGDNNLRLQSFAEAFEFLPKAIPWTTSREAAQQSGDESTWHRHRQAILAPRGCRRAAPSLHPPTKAGGRVLSLPLHPSLSERHLKGSR